MPFAFNKNLLKNLPSILIDADEIATNSLILTVNGKFVFVTRNTLLHPSEAVNCEHTTEFLQLGEFENRIVYIHTENQTISESEEDNWWSLRRIATELPVELASIAAQAYSISDWHQNNPYCSKCGANTNIGKEHSRECCNLACGQVRFPRIDPAIIVSVTNENDEILLGRDPNWKDGMYSVLAGFLGHGESLEQCVIREIKEEAGIDVESVEYIASQAWPFPGAVMIGFQAKAKNQPINLQDDELEDAFWISRNTLREKVRSGELLMSNKLSISRYLLDLWLDGETTALYNVSKE